MVCKSQHATLECKCLKMLQNMRFVIFFIGSSIPMLKWQHVLPMEQELQLTQVDLKSSGIRFLYEKCDVKLMLSLILNFSLHYCFWSFESFTLICTATYKRNCFWKTSTHPKWKVPK